MANVISCVLNVEMSTGFVQVTIKILTYLHSLQNVFRMDYTLLPRVPEVLYTWISSIQSALHYRLYFLTIEEWSQNSSGLRTWKSPAYIRILAVPWSRYLCKQNIDSIASYITHNGYVTNINWHTLILSDSVKLSCFCGWSYKSKRAIRITLVNMSFHTKCKTNHRGVVCK